MVLLSEDLSYEFQALQNGSLETFSLLYDSGKEKNVGHYKNLDLHTQTWKRTCKPVLNFSK